MNNVVNQIIDSVTDVIEISREDIKELGYNTAISNALYEVSKVEDSKYFKLEMFQKGEDEGYILTFRNNEKLYINQDYITDDVIGLGIYDELQGHLMPINDIYEIVRQLTRRPR